MRNRHVITVRPEIVLARARLGAELARWRRTRYVAGQQLPGPSGGTNCVMFVDACLRAFTLTNPPALPRNADDASLHSDETVRSMMRHFLRHYPSDRLPDSFAQAPRSPYLPGDVLAVMLGSVLFHVGIVGIDRREFWHATHSGVTKSSVQAIPSMGYAIREAYRPKLPEAG